MHFFDPMQHNCFEISMGCRFTDEFTDELTHISAFFVARHLIATFFIVFHEHIYP